MEVEGGEWVTWGVGEAICVCKRSACKQVVRAIKSGFEEMKKINLGLASVKTIEKLDDKLKMLWLMVKYGTTNVLKIMAATLPLLQQTQPCPTCCLNKRLTRICIGIPHYCFRPFHPFLPNFQWERLEQFSLLRPPAMECYSCSRSIVSYLTTGVKLYTCWCTGNGEEHFAMHRMPFGIQPNAIRKQAWTRLSVLC